MAHPQKADSLIVNAGEVVTCAGFSDAPARGADQGSLGIVTHGAVAMANGCIVDVGPESDVGERTDVEAARRIDARGGVVLPGFVDAHTHLVFGGDRAAEWEARMGGKPYLDILRDGGGILSTVQATRKASFDELLERARVWAGRCLEHGTTTLETKSGYCLDREGELKLLEVAAALRSERAPAIVATYLGAHVVPEELRENRGEYIALIESLLSEIRDRNLAEFVDVFCETEAFTVEETERILNRARKLDFGLKLHAEQFTSSGAAALGARLGAASVDHLEHISDDDISALAQAPGQGFKGGPVAVLLPAVPFHLGMSDAAPARALVNANVPVALATDFNPGSSFTPSIPMVIALAARSLGLTAAESIIATTINAAHALSLGSAIGSLESGKRADVIICDIPDHRWLAYAFGWNPVSAVFVAGEQVK